MEDKVVLALIGGFVGLITAIITSWLNKRAFLEEIAESDILKIQIQDYKLIWDIITNINFETTQLVSWIASQMSVSGKKELKEGDPLLEEINKEYNPKSTKILVTVMTLRKYYVTIPVPLIEHLKRYEELIWEMFKQKHFKKLHKLNKVSEDIFKSIRDITAKLIRREVKMSDSVRGVPKRGFLPEYFKKACK